MQEYSSVTEFLESETALSQSGATVTTTANGDTVLTARIRLADHPNDEAVDISALNMQEIERLRDADPFMYHSIVSERRRSSLFDFDDDDDDDAVDGPVQFNFDLQDIERLGPITRHRRRASLYSLDVDDSVNAGDRDPSFSQSDHINADNAPANGGSVHSGIVRVRSAAGGRRRSSLFNLDEESTAGPDPADVSAGSVHSVSVSVESEAIPRRVTSRARQQRQLSQSLQPRRPASSARLERIGGGSFTTTSSGSSIVARKRRFSTEAHSSLIMANLAAALRGAALTPSPDLDSLFDGEDIDNDMDLLQYLRED
ncbi:hypothetical protein HJC23_004262 [Cyclotella cryptica]|uniref:Uncharacterized protein n=1 Tax=Cyclotella cryptica TaxID=29204 RepID=A0ABD3PIT9_9STRA|eukprot:CCRYP_014639-RA/>CCRYP_014639-RA protein AED:0.04 eAED:0.04 QI:97/1/1/1/0/0/2/981/313